VAQRNLISVIKWRTWRFKSMLIAETKCIDDHFLCLLRLVVMSVLKSKVRGEYIHINGFEFVGQFFQGHGIAPICYYDFALRDLVSEPIYLDNIADSRCKKGEVPLCRGIISISPMANKF
jgi:hypothetical protein